MTGQHAAVTSSSGAELTAGANLDLRTWIPALFIGATVACIASLALLTLPAPPAPQSHMLASRHGLRSHVAIRPPITLAPTASASVGASGGSFGPVRRGASLLTLGGGIRSAFTTSGAALRVTQGTLGLSLTAAGRGERLDPVAAVEPKGAADRVLYRHGSITEYYRNGSYGLEQGFNLQHRPRAGSGALVLVVRLGGSLTPEQTGSQILFRTHSGATALRYGQLSALDATGRRLLARIQVRTGSLELRIDDSHARYPLWIDPYILTALSPPSVAATGLEPVGVQVSPDGQNAYVGVEFGKEFYQFSRDPASGALTPLSPAKVKAGEDPRTLAISPDGKDVYVGNFNSSGPDGKDTISQYSRNAETGALTEIGSEVKVPFGPHGLAVSPDGKSVYVACYGEARVAQLNRNTTTGLLTALSPAFVAAGAHPNGIAISTDGKSVYTANRFGNTVSQYSRNAETGRLTALAPAAVATGENPHDVALSPDGRSVYVPNAAETAKTKTLSQFSRNTETGVLTPLSPATVETAGEARGVAVSSDGESVYVANGTEGVVSQYSRNTTTGLLAQLSPPAVPAGTHSYSVAVSPDGKSAYVTNEKSDDISQYSRAIRSPPTVETEAAWAVSQSAAILNATVNPNGGTVSDCHFDYGTSESYGSSAPCTALPGSGATPVAVSASVAGLSANTIYHFRIAATNLEGTTHGSEQTLTTLPTAEEEAAAARKYEEEAAAARKYEEEAAAVRKLEEEAAAQIKKEKEEAAQIARLLRQGLTPSGPFTRIATLLKSGAFSTSFRALQAGTAVINWYQVPPGATLAKKAKPKPVLVASGRRSVSAAGIAKIKIKLTAAGRRLLKQARQLKLTAKGTFTPTGKTPITATKAFVLKRR